MSLEILLRRVRVSEYNLFGKRDPSKAIETKIKNN
jgi:hypothetical protein